MPQSFHKIPIREVVVTQKGIKPILLKEKPFLGSFPYLDISVLETGEIKEYTVKELGSITSETDVLMVWDGSRSGLVFRGRTGVIGSTIMGLTPVGLDTDYLYYYLKSKFDFINGNTIGTGIPHVNTEIFFNLEIPYYSIKQQKKIVLDLHKKISENAIILEQHKNVIQVTLAAEQIDFKIDEDIEKTIHNFRNAVLKMAMSGKLVNSYSKNISNDDKLKYKNVTSGFIFFDCPDNWELKKIIDLGTLQRGKSSFRPRNDDRLFGDKYPFIQTGDVANSNGFIVANSVFYNEFGLAQSRIFPKDTLCITIAANIGKTALLTYPACFPDSVVGFISNEEILPKYALYFFKAIEEQLESLAPSNAAQKNININLLSKIYIPIPSIKEQKEIVAKVELLLQTADKMHSQYLEGISYFEKLEKSILQQTFSVESKERYYESNIDYILTELAAAKIKVEQEKKQSSVLKLKIRTAMKRDINAKKNIEDILKENEIISVEDLWKESKYFENKKVESFYEDLVALKKDKKIKTEFTDETKLITNIMLQKNAD